MAKIGLSHLMKAHKLHQGLPEERASKLQESVIGRDGIYLSYKSEFFDIVYQIEKFGQRAQEIMERTKVDEVEQAVKFAEKIPSKYIYKMIAWFRDVNEKSSAEATMQVFYDETGEKELPKELEEIYGGSFKRDGNFIFIVPEQLVSKGNVVFSGDKSKGKIDTELYDWAMSNLEPVLNMHSHNSMGAFWSAEDDANELPLYTRLCLVVGRVDTDKPEYKLSWNFEGKRHDQKVNVDEIFEPLEIDMNVSDLGYSRKQTIGFNEGLDFIDFDEVTYDESWNDRLVERVTYTKRSVSQLKDHVSQDQLEELLHSVEGDSFDDLEDEYDYLGDVTDEDYDRLPEDIKKFSGLSKVDTSILDREDELYGDIELDLEKEREESRQTHKNRNKNKFVEKGKRVKIKDEKEDSLSKSKRNRGRHRGKGRRGR